MTVKIDSNCHHTVDVPGEGRKVKTLKVFAVFGVPFTGGDDRAGMLRVAVHRPNAGVMNIANNRNVDSTLLERKTKKVLRKQLGKQKKGTQSLDCHFVNQNLLP